MKRLPNLGPQAIPLPHTDSKRPYYLARFLSPWLAQPGVLPDWWVQSCLLRWWGPGSKHTVHYRTHSGQATTWVHKRSCFPRLVMTLPFLDHTAEIQLGPPQCPSNSGSCSLQSFLENYGKTHPSRQDSVQCSDLQTAHVQANCCCYEKIPFCVIMDLSASSSVLATLPWPLILLYETFPECTRYNIHHPQYSIPLSTVKER